MSEDRNPEQLDNMIVVIGAMKCATSSLHAYLKLHPALSMSRLKELNFFIEEKNWPRGLGWYRSRFDEGAAVRGESSPNYTKHHLFPGVPERMHALMPAATLVYIMRHPVDRIVSHYMHNVGNGRERRSFEEAMADLEDNNYILTSAYHEQLDRFLALYPREQLLLFDIAEMKDDPRSVLRTIFEHLGVDPGFDHDAIGKVFHRTARKRKPRDITRQIEKLPGGWIWRHALPFALTTPIVKPRPSAALRARLAEHLRPDVERLEELWGRDLTAWKS